MSDTKVELHQLEKAVSVDSAAQTSFAERCKAKYSELADSSLDELAVESKKLSRKVDLRLMVPLWTLYLTNYLDRNAAAAAKLAGLTEELKISSTQWSTVISILFVGYCLGQVPSNLLLSRLSRPAVYLCTCVTVWGGVSAATAACQDYHHLVACRAILGLVESVFFPAALFYISSWYPRKELGIRTAVLYSGSIVSGAVGGLLAAGVLKGMDHKLGLRAWRWLFIIEGAVTIAVAAVAIFVMPNFPQTTKWLSPRERQLAVWRLEVDAGEVDEHGDKAVSVWTSLKQAFSDIRTYMLLVIVLGIVMAAGITNFFPSVVAGIGKFTKVQSLLLTAPPYILCLFTLFPSVVHADKTQERTWHITASLSVAIVAFIIAASTTNPAARYLSMMLVIPGLYTNYPTALAWISNSIPRPAGKRAVALAFINAATNAASIATPYFYYSDGTVGGAPRYVTAMLINLAGCAVTVIMCQVLKFHLKRDNARMDREEAQGIAVHPTRFIY
ncbi:hypothetical protein PYCC9005_005857 [Savitreella phatthalungensis]